MEECPTDAALLNRTTCIVTYGGDRTNIWINYVTLLVVLLVSVVRARNVLHHRNRRMSQQQGGGNNAWLGASVAALLGVIAFQIVLCWNLGCAGISIVWCAVAGWIVNERRRCQPEERDVAAANDNRSRLDVVEDFTLTAVLAVLVYYALTMEPITTVAHACALILGALLSRLNRYLVWGRQETSSSSPSSSPQACYETFAE